MAHRMATTSETLTGTRALTTSEARQYLVWHLDPGGADRQVTLPTETSMTGQLLHIFNTADAAENITVAASNGTTFVGSVAQGADALLACDGTSWRMRDKRRQRVLAETLAADRILTAAEVITNDVIALDPGGSARNVDLSATTTVAGYSFLLINTADAAEAITVRLTSGGATVATVEQSEHALLTCFSATAGSWVGMVSKAT